MRLAWATDVHVNFLQAPEVAKFCDLVAERPAEAFLLTGDIAEAPSVEPFLLQLEARLERPIYFVLGNHDFWGSSIEATRAAMRALTARSRWLRWLSDSPPVALTERTGLIGHEGWSDGRFGDFEGSNVLMNDFIKIQELRVGFKKGELLGVLNRLGDDAAAHLERHLPSALERFEHVVVATHYPPWREACWDYENPGHVGDEHMLPHLGCAAVGAVLERHARARPDRKLTVLCGHTHAGGRVQPLPNVTVITGPAEYRTPWLQETLELD